MRKEDWPSVLIIWITACQCTEACFDSSGSFYCASLWYFWVGIFLFCFGIFISVICIVNRCNKSKKRVDVLQFPLTPSAHGNSTQRSHAGQSVA